MPKIASKTKQIKIGCGGIMLNNYQPQIVIEQINTLNVLYPNRFVYGFGSNKGTKEVQEKLNSNNALNYYQKLEEILANFNNSNLKEKTYLANPVVNYNNDFYMLITSSQSALFAAKNKLKIIFGWFLCPSFFFAKDAIETYRKEWLRLYNEEPTEIGICINAASGKNESETKKISKQIATFRFKLNNLDHFEHFPTYAEFLHFSKVNLNDTEKNTQFVRIYENIFKINKKQDIEAIATFCQKLNIDHLVVSPLAEKQTDKKRVLTFFC